MNPDGPRLQESYELSPEQVATALSDTVLRALLALSKDLARGGPLGAFQSVDRVVELVRRWFLRLVLGGVPLAFGIYLIAVAGQSKLGILAIAASFVLLLLVQVLEWLFARVGKAFDSATDFLVTGPGGRRLRKAIERGQVKVLSGTLHAELAGDRLSVRSEERTVTIPSTRTAWRARTPSYLVVSANAPGLPPEYSDYVLLPADGEIATAIDGPTARAERS